MSQAHEGDRLLTDGDHQPPRYGADEATYQSDETTARNSSASSDNNDGDAATSTLNLMVKLSGLFIAAFLAALDSTLVGTLVVPISASFGNQKLLSWLASSFFIATCLSQPIVGKITDIYGRKGVLISLNVVFSLGNLICAVTGSEWGLIAGRVVAGLGGGCLGPIGSMILSDIIPLRRRGVWQGAMNICFGIGSGLGGPLGGWIAETIGWRWAFAVQVPVTAVCLILIAIKLPETALDVGKEGRLNKLKRIDWLGSASILMCLLTLLFGLNAGGNYLPWKHPAVIASLAVSILFLACFIFVEGKVAAEPVLPLALFKNRTIITACLVNWFCSMARFGLLFYAPLFFQLQGYSVSQAGLRFIPESIATAIASISAGMLMRATGRYYEQDVVAVCVNILGLCLISTMQLETPAWPPFIYLFFTGLGYSGMITTTLIAVIASTEQSWQAVATSASYLFRGTGSVIGITVASVVFQNVLNTSLWNRIGDRKDAAQIIDAIQRDLHEIDHLPEALGLSARQSYLTALRAVFLTLVGFSAAGLVSAALMKQHKLHKTLSRRD